ncbi:hypothetical protein [Oceanibacterium hippocampi]|uniref:Uncharacterized protein n=1 Tax=Oceanibacterium hippocampi TaxID=745714 RepID=A0A1Y5RRM5_9PROT|nr:hypothetical protein [Oceanibacterium hippocampi]SLN23474.1 hypothetical protein OCH7691_00637 [Oceanibacterium hippocampi]
MQRTAPRTDFALPGLEMWTDPSLIAAGTLDWAAELVVDAYGVDSIAIVEDKARRLDWAGKSELAAAFRHVARAARVLLGDAAPPASRRMLN